MRVLPKDHDYGPFRITTYYGKDGVWQYEVRLRVVDKKVRPCLVGVAHTADDQRQAQQDAEAHLKEHLRANGLSPAEYEEVQG